MKNQIFFALLSAICFSCTAVKFEEPQPVNSQSLEEFPEEMRGIFVSSEQDTLQIEAQAFRYSSGKDVSVSTTLSASEAVLRKMDKKYVLSLKEEDGWDVFPLKISRNRLVAQYVQLTPATEKLILNMKSTSAVKTIKTEDGKFDHYLVAPSEKDFQKLVRKRLFSNKMVFKRLK
ncbi:hypothetical protein [Salinimicrobium oceani]|uniref:Uncharacterized protein n=1 Tax=Salinimicrobium oceani TaxID=2722702 RepID=A0ABX1CWD3_9FLAO|nr:hypothetical protein [Salinimicrobium oceani]NJW52593.1 hypothetical protein [Salinimicrobium oceani]